MKIKKVEAREILDSRGNPTVSCRVVLDGDITGEAAVPSGASTGKYEALELRDGDPQRYGGKGVLKAVKNVNEVIGPKLIGGEAEEQEKIDRLMMEMDGTENKAVLGANAILSVSLAVCRAGAQSLKLPLYQYLQRFFGGEMLLPIPMMNVLNGGKHAVGGVDFQEFMIMPTGAQNFAEVMRMGVEIYQILGELIKDRGLATDLGDEGGFVPKLSNNEEPLKLLIEAIGRAGYEGKIFLALDPAASSFYENGRYQLKKEGRSLDSQEMINLYEEWAKKYPIVSIEDGLSEDDWEGFGQLTQKLGKNLQIVGDDLYVTNLRRLQKGIEMKATNSILIKLNQIGTLTETIEVMKKAKVAGMTQIVSHRSGETEDAFIADLSVASGCGQIKTGAPSQNERMAKYQRLLEIERESGLKLAKWALFV